MEEGWNLTIYSSHEVQIILSGTDCEFWNEQLEEKCQNYQLKFYTEATGTQRNVKIFSETRVCIETMKLERHLYVQIYISFVAQLNKKNNSQYVRADKMNDECRILYNIMNTCNV